MGRELLGGEDAAWLHMDQPTNPMVVNGLVELAKPLDLDRAWELVARLADVPRFRSRLVERAGRFGLPSWEPVPDFDPRRHVDRVELERGGDADLAAFVGEIISAQLDPARPLWKVHLIERPGSGTTILFRVHHAVADGFALLGLLLSLCDEAPALEDVRSTPIHLATTTSIRRSGKALERLVTLPPDPNTLLKGPLSTEKRVAWSAPIPLADVKKAGRAASATVNDVLVAVVAGALRRYLERRGEETDTIEIHAMVPVNLRRSLAHERAGNRFGLVVLGLPVGIASPLARVSAVKRRMDAIKASPEAVVAYELLSGLGRAPRRVEELAVGFFGKKTSLVLTNVPGPRAPVSLAGVPVSRIVFWVPQAARMGLGISIFSYAGAVTVGVLSDAAILHDPSALVRDVHAEYTALTSEVADLLRRGAGYHHLAPSR